MPPRIIWQNAKPKQAWRRCKWRIAHLCHGPSYLEFFVAWRGRTYHFHPALELSGGGVAAPATGASELSVPAGWTENGSSVVQPVSKRTLTRKTKTPRTNRLMWKMTSQWRSRQCENWDLRQIGSQRIDGAKLWCRARVTFAFRGEIRSFGSSLPSGRRTGRRRQPRLLRRPKYLHEDDFA